MKATESLRDCSAQQPAGRIDSTYAQAFYLRALADKKIDSLARVAAAKLAAAAVVARDEQTQVQQVNFALLSRSFARYALLPASLAKLARLASCLPAYLPV